MKPQEAIEYYKSRVMLAATLQITEQTVKNWLAKGKIPYTAQLAIQASTKGKLKATQDE